MKIKKIEDNFGTCIVEIKADRHHTGDNSIILTEKEAKRAIKKLIELFK
jgi:hypothetical protein